MNRLTIEKKFFSNPRRTQIIALYLKTTKSLNKDTLSKPVNNKKQKIKLHSGKNLHCVENDYFHED